MKAKEELREKWPTFVSGGVSDETGYEDFIERMKAAGLVAERLVSTWGRMTFSDKMNETDDDSLVFVLELTDSGKSAMENAE